MFQDPLDWSGESRGSLQLFFFFFHVCKHDVIRSTFCSTIFVEGRPRNKAKGKIFEALSAQDQDQINSLHLVKFEFC